MSIGTEQRGPLYTLVNSCSDSSRLGVLKHKKMSVIFYDKLSDHIS